MFVFGYSHSANLTLDTSLLKLQFNCLLKYKKLRFMSKLTAIMSLVNCIILHFHSKQIITVNKMKDNFV